MFLGGLRVKTPSLSINLHEERERLSPGISSGELITSPSPSFRSRLLVERQQRLQEQQGGGVTLEQMQRQEEPPTIEELVSMKWQQRVSDMGDKSAASGTGSHGQGLSGQGGEEDRNGQGPYGASGQGSEAGRKVCMSSAI
mgnify:CR=1 FL=1